MKNTCKDNQKAKRTKQENQVICIVCQNEKPESEMDEVSICKYCRGEDNA